MPSGLLQNFLASFQQMKKGSCGGVFYLCVRVQLCLLQLLGDFWDLNFGFAWSSVQIMENIVLVAIIPEGNNIMRYETCTNRVLHQPFSNSALYSPEGSGRARAGIRERPKAATFH